MIDPAALHDVLAPHVGPDEVPGVVALVAAEDTVHVEALGRRALDGPPMTRDTIVRISSMTKPVTAVAALLLVADGLLTLDGSLDRLLPELADRRVLRSIDADLDDTVPAHRPLTLRDLLTSRMGLGTILAAPGTHPVQSAMDARGLTPGPPGDVELPAPDEWLRRLGELPLLSQPGERWHYDLPFDVLGALLARAAEQPLPALLAERVFAPLGLRDTGFHVPAGSMPRFATAYAPGPVVTDEPATGAWSREPAFPSGAGGLVSTADDFFAFSEALRTGRLLPPATVARMTSDQLGPGQADGVILGPGQGWGFGVGTGPQLGRYGWAGGLGTMWGTDPTGTAVLLTQLRFDEKGPHPLFADFWAAW